MQGRDPEVHAYADLRRFAHFGWGDDFTYDVDEERSRVTMSAPGVPSRVAQFNGDQGCSVLPRGADDVHFEPTRTSYFSVRKISRLSMLGGSKLTQNWQAAESQCHVCMSLGKEGEWPDR